ncbi:Uncharacterized conserved protein, contains Mth938-like domain [Formivibrio citricus]|uniref:Uncharacterized conserved protein, contains Mth938-like domain n=1 Tax=Formivibrio citricus TaxID=83765 RepID=A0A1I4V415_9NEIS|nr:MTH938/NDUFAF3 family protein [Formivibrio citricus]SFM95977.1 Uncharacterized conserved protein, contains Mth938-like domain [Formivibrio citricus]
MKLVQEKNTHLNQFTGYGEDWVGVNGEKRYGSLIVTAVAVDLWRPAGFGDLLREDFAVVVDYRPEVVLLGTGSRNRFPLPALYRDLTDAGIGIEIMDTGAVCRTFNALAGDGRSVVALVLFG